MASEPVFHRRKNPTKRRGRPRLSSPPSSASNSPPPASATAEPSRKPPTSRRVAPASRRRKGLLAPPTIPGYDPEPAPAAPPERYTAETIARLKRQSERLPPLAVAASPNSAPGDAGTQPYLGVPVPGMKGTSATQPLHSPVMAHPCALSIASPTHGGEPLTMGPTKGHMGHPNTRKGNPAGASQQPGRILSNPREREEIVRRMATMNYYDDTYGGMHVEQWQAIAMHLLKHYEFREDTDRQITNGYVRLSALKDELRDANPSGPRVTIDHCKEVFRILNLHVTGEGDRPGREGVRGPYCYGCVRRSGEVMREKACGEPGDAAAREARAVECPTKPADDASHELRGAPGRPDPFSAGWRDGLMRTDGAREDDSDVIVVDDYAGVDDAPAFIPLSSGADVEAAAPDGARDGADGEDDDASAGEWEMEQLRRAGHAVTKDGDAVSAKVARRFVQAAEEGRRQTGAVTACLRAAREARMEWGARKELAEGKLRRLGEAERGGDTAAREVEREIDRKKRRLVFYDGLAARVDDVTDMLKEKQEEIVAARKRFLARLQAEAELVRQCLSGGVDEFGRTRAASLELPEPEADDNAEDVLGDVVEESRSIEALARVFTRWREEYGKEYKEAFGDVGLGKLAGRLGLTMGDGEVRWARALSGESRVQALRASNAGETVAAAVMARWHPRERESCEKFGRLGREVALACGVRGREEIITAFRERVMVEIEGCRGVSDVREAGVCIGGTIRVVRMLGWDIGIAKVLRIAVEEGWGRTMWDVRTLEEIRWVVEEGKDIVDEEGIRLARKFCGEDAMGD